MKTIEDNEIFNTVRSFADILCGAASPLFPGQLNAATRRVPAGTPEDPGVFAGNVEIAGCGPHCSNLMYELGLLDVLNRLTFITGDGKYSAAADAHLKYLFDYCLYPESSYIPWGEHVGYDFVDRKIIRGDFKGMHEVKGNQMPWANFWRIAPDVVQNEIGTAFRNHICDEESFSFNRHAPMDGKSNAGVSPCSLADSGGTYLYGWIWLYKKTGDVKYLDWARKMEAHFWNKRFSATGLFCTAEDRPDECWYADALSLGVFLLDAYEKIGDEWRELKDHGISYFNAYFKTAFNREKNGFMDTFNVADGSQVFGISKHIPDRLPEGYEREYIRAYTRPDLLPTWDGVDNSSKVVSVAVATAAGLACVRDDAMLEMFDIAMRLLAIDDAVARGQRIRAGDGAGVILALLHVFRKTGKEEYLRQAGVLTQHMLNTCIANGMFTTGIGGFNQYYAIRAGSDDLASAVLAYWMVKTGSGIEIPPIRDLYGIMPW